MNNLLPLKLKILTMRLSIGRGNDVTQNICFARQRNGAKSPMNLRGVRFACVNREAENCSHFYNSLKENKEHTFKDILSLSKTIQQRKEINLTLSCSLVKCGNINLVNFLNPKLLTCTQVTQNRVSRKLRPRKLRPQTRKTQTLGCLENSDLEKTQTLGCMR